MTSDEPQPFAFITEGDRDPSEMSDFELIGRTLWELAGRSVRRLVVAFALFFVGSALPTVLLISFALATNAGATRGVVLAAAGVALAMTATYFALNYVVYCGLRDVVQKMALGARLGAAFAAKLDRQGLDHIPIEDFSKRLGAFLAGAAEDSKPGRGGLRSWFARTTHRVLFFGVRVVLNRVARDCVVDGKVDVAAFAERIGERTDQMIIRYFRGLLWDLMRIVVSFAIFVIWSLVIVISLVI